MGFLEAAAEARTGDARGTVGEPPGACGIAYIGPGMRKTGDGMLVGNGIGCGHDTTDVLSRGRENGSGTDKSS